ncbi:MAG: hypothetical protein OXC91_12580, partial [Rhodobacteraceae bacterium]|nr:hypothetical protein [Paracoccaceae bacterium]
SMKYQYANEVLHRWAQQGRAVFTIDDLRRIFPEASRASFSVGLKRLTDKGLLTNALRGVYVFDAGLRSHAHLLETIVTCARRGEYNYLSMESALSEYGVISQISTGRITVMTTGRSGKFRTPYGGILFHHTARHAQGILENTREVGRPIRIAAPATALRDLRRVRGSVDLVDMKAYEDVIREIDGAANKRIQMDEMDIDFFLSGRR